MRALIEFERYTTNSLERKARNLLLMANSCTEDIELLVLMYWTAVVRDQSELQTAAQLTQRGFRSNGIRIGPAPCPFLFLETLTWRCGEQLTVADFIARQFVFSGEDKPYIVNELNT